MRKEIYVGPGDYWAICIGHSQVYDGNPEGEVDPDKFVPQINGWRVYLDTNEIDIGLDELKVQMGLL